MVTIDKIEQKIDKRRNEIRARILIDESESSLFFQWRGAMCPNPADVFLMSVLGLAMTGGHDLGVEGKVSADIAPMLDHLQDRLVQWYQGIGRIVVEAGSIKISNIGEEKTGNLTGSIFWGDINSYFTLAETLPETQALVYIPDTDGLTNDHHHHINQLQLIKHTASELDKELIHIDTNLEDLYQGESPDIFHFFSGLSAGWLLSGLLSRLYIPGSMNGDDFSAGEAKSIFEDWPESDSIDLKHHGTRMVRNEKIEIILSNPHVLDTIRVCWENPGRAYNCGRCGSCRRIKSPLEVINALN